MTSKPPRKLPALPRDALGFVLVMTEPYEKPNEPKPRQEIMILGGDEGRHCYFLR